MEKLYTQSKLYPELRAKRFEKITFSIVLAFFGGMSLGFFIINLFT